MGRLLPYFMTVTFIALAGCGQIAIKRGSGADALAADRASCQEQNTDSTAVKSCLAAHGWHITELESAPAAAGAYPAVTIAQPAPVAAGPAPPPPPIQPVQGSDKIHVGGWWHFGGGPADLHVAVDGCVSKLGAGDQPDAGYHTVTRALYTCLSSEGWRSLGS